MDIEDLPDTNEEEQQVLASEPITYAAEEPSQFSSIPEPEPTGFSAFPDPEPEDALAYVLLFYYYGSFRLINKN